MLTVPGYPADLTSVEPTIRVTHNGVVRSAESVSVGRELPSNLPEQVAGGSGITAATGSVVWAEGDLSESKAAHPWEAKPFPPRKQDTVTVDAGYNGVNVRKLTGFIDSTSGSVQPESWDVSSEIVDGIDRLNRSISLLPMLAATPGRYDYEPRRLIGITPTYFTNLLLRECGFYATPPMEAGCVVSAPLMGSSWPERGLVNSSSGSDGSTGRPVWSETPWGQGATSLTAYYEPDLTYASGKLDQTLQLTVSAGPLPTTSTGANYVMVRWGSLYIRVVVTASRAIQAQIYNGTTTPTPASLTPSQALTADQFTLRVTPAGVFTLFANNGVSASGSSALPSAMTTTPMTEARVVTTNGACVPIGGFQVAFNSATGLVPHTRNAYLTPAAYRFSLEASPAIDSRNILDLLKEQSEAECAAMWIDEAGTFRWVNRTALVSGNAVETIDSLDDIESVSWEHNTGSVRSRVEVSSRVPNISKPQPKPTRLAWEGSGESLESGEESVEIASPPADVDWHYVDEYVPLVGTVGVDLGPFNKGRRSHGGGVQTDGTTEKWAQVDNTGFTCTISKIGLSTFKIVTTAGTLPAGWSVELRTLDEGVSSQLWRRWRNQKLPILRCKALTKWTDQTVTGATLGPASAPVLEHDAGWWVDPNGAQALADWLSAQVAAPIATIRDLTVIPDDRRQLGDIVLVQFATVTLRCLIVGIRESVSGSGKTQALTLRVISVAKLGVTNDEMDAAYSTKTNSQLDSLWAAETNNTLDSDPLRKA